MSPDVNTLRAENRMLKNKIRTLQNDLQTEQGTIVQVCTQIFVTVIYII